MKRAIAMTLVSAITALLVIAGSTACESYFLSDVLPDGGDALAPPGDGGSQDAGDGAPPDAGPTRPARIYIYGGSPDGVSLPEDVDAEAFYADILPSGMLGPWQNALKPPTSMIWHTAVQGPDFFALIGGIVQTHGGSEKYFIGAVSDGGVTGFSTSPDLVPEKIAHAGSVLRGTNLWIVGGEIVDTSAINHVWHGTLTAGTYSTPVRGPDLPSPLTRSALAVAPDAVYLAGGNDQNGDAQATILRASLSPSGDLSAFSAAGALPSARRYSAAVVSGGSLLVVGGNQKADLPNVVTCPIDARGAVGTCLETTPLPLNRSRHAALLYRGRIYVVGGGAGEAGDADTFVGDVRADGTIAGWQKAPPLPTPAVYGTAVLF